MIYVLQFMFQTQSILKIMIYNVILWFNHLIYQTKKLQFLKDENFTKLSYFMMMEEFEYCNLLRQLNEEKILIFDDVMHKKNYTLIHWFVYFWQGVLELV